MFIQTNSENVRTSSGNEIVEIGRALDALAAFAQDVSIHHRRPNVTVTKEFLHGADVVAGGDGASRLSRQGAAMGAATGSSQKKRVTTPIELASLREDGWPLSPAEQMGRETVSERVACGPIGNARPYFICRLAAKLSRQLTGN